MPRVHPNPPHWGRRGVLAHTVSSPRANRIRPSPDKRSPAHPRPTHTPSAAFTLPNLRIPVHAPVTPHQARLLTLQHSRRQYSPRAYTGSPRTQRDSPATVRESVRSVGASPRANATGNARVSVRVSPHMGSGTYGAGRGGHASHVHSPRPGSLFRGAGPHSRQSDTSQRIPVYMPAYADRDINQADMAEAQMEGGYLATAYALLQTKPEDDRLSVSPVAQRDPHSLKGEGEGGRCIGGTGEGLSRSSEGGSLSDAGHVNEMAVVEEGLEQHSHLESAGPASDGPPSTPNHPPRQSPGVHPDVIGRGSLEDLLGEPGDQEYMSPNLGHPQADRDRERHREMRERHRGRIDPTVPPLSPFPLRDSAKFAPRHGNADGLSPTRSFSHLRAPGDIDPHDTRLPFDTGLGSETERERETPREGERQRGRQASDPAARYYNARETNPQLLEVPGLGGSVVGGGVGDPTCGGLLPTPPPFRIQGENPFASPLDADSVASPSLAGVPVPTSLIDSVPKELTDGVMSHRHGRHGHPPGTRGTRGGRAVVRGRPGTDASGVHVVSGSANRSRVNSRGGPRSKARGRERDMEWRGHPAGDRQDIGDMVRWVPPQGHTSASASRPSSTHMASRHSGQVELSARVPTIPEVPEEADQDAHPHYLDSSVSPVQSQAKLYHSSPSATGRDRVPRSLSPAASGHNARFRVEVVGSRYVTRPLKRTQGSDGVGASPSRKRAEERQRQVSAAQSGEGRGHTFQGQYHRREVATHIQSPFAPDYSAWKNRKAFMPPRKYPRQALAYREPY
ncbi:hypothetical protein KIPB_003308 [Kipferlia bialata]|uniref:Uncharacterized protein n=1 Tax=Kipferlia bialata TaxID=797122 RepID=A0A9K3GGZ1_9EUKA|nr:hypothetical protein KIPB_003308 [Kipferlia bialata]|eukprot:g3308.t1